MNKTLTKLILLLAFIEGGAVMCVELCSAKILSPYFGTSIYVWASVLGITLTALMSGYYLGGYLSSKNKNQYLVYWIMLIGGLLTCLIPIISEFILPYIIDHIISGSIIGLLSFLFAPLMLFGATSPLIINLLTEQAKKSGKSSGTVYAVSTLGGIFTTFIVGFYTLPTFGITNTLYGYGILIIVFSSYLIIQKKAFNSTILFIILIALVSYNFRQKKTNENIIYQSEGILGEIKVVDRIHYDKNQSQQKEYRELMVNNISQTIMDKENPSVSYWDYVNVLTRNINSYAHGKQTLLLGLGGGTLYKQLINNKLEVDVVEIDQRIERLAKKYFHITDNLNIVIDDARHYINVTEKKYDIIIYDLYHSETPPIHLMTQEAFKSIKKKLTQQGILIINFYGYINGEKGKAARSIYKTLLAENYNIQLVATPGNESSRNLLFIASNEQLTAKNQVTDLIINKNTINLKNAVTLTDNKPLLEHIYLEAALDWRKNYNEINAKQFLFVK